MAWASSPESRMIPAAGSGSPLSPLPTPGMGSGFIPRERGPVPLHQHRWPPRSWHFSGCMAVMLGMGRRGVWAKPPLLCLAWSQGAPNLRPPPGPGGLGPCGPPSPRGSPVGQRRAAPTPSIVGTPSSRRLCGARLVSREGTRRWTQERGGVSEWERGGREGEELERGPGARAGAPTPHPTASPPRCVYVTLQAAEINSGASPLPPSTSLGQGWDGVVGRQHWGGITRASGAGLGWMRGPASP